MDPLEQLLRPLTRILNRNIGEMTPAREIARRLDGKTIAIRVRGTGLAMYVEIDDETIVLKSMSDKDPDVVLEGSLFTLARMAAPPTESSGGTIRGGELDVSGDAYTAQAFQELLRFARPDFEEELSHMIGDTAAFRAGQFARDLSEWARQARETIGSNIREYLQEESRDLPSRYEVERFAHEVEALRDDVARLEARVNRLPGSR
jgi:ubiquinone biosynthesis protein UbiJ